MIDLSEFKNSDDGIISETALKLEDLLTSVDHQVLTNEQFEEIVQDLLEVEKINNLAIDQERKNKILAAFDLMDRLLGTFL